jgi:hypothetical protein
MVVTTAPVAHGTRTARSSAARQLTDTSQLAKRRPKRSLLLIGGEHVWDVLDRERA